MRVALRRLPLEATAPVVFGLTIVAVTLGSSSVPDVSRLGRPLRWLALAALVSVAVPAARRLHPGRIRLRADLILAITLVALAALSTAWSVDPRLTFARAVTLAAALAAAGALALGAVRSRAFAGRLVTSVASAAVAVAILGVVVLVLAPGYAIQAAGTHGSARFRGLGQNPNTMSMLYALVLPCAWWLLLTADAWLRRAAAGLAVVGLSAAILVSSSRGATLAAVAGLAVTSVLARPLRWSVVAVVCIVLGFGVGVGIMQAARWDYRSDEPAAEAARPEVQDPFAFLNGHTPLGNDPNEVGRPLPDGDAGHVTRTFLSSSGRIQAWRGAIDQARQRPLLGYGFGTEEKVFVDRFYTFQGARPENAAIGTALQLGAAGLLLLLGLLGTFAVSLWRLVRGDARTRVDAAPFAGAVAAGAVLMVVQSYVTSVGNVAMLAFWCSLLSVGALAARGSRTT